MSVNMRALVAAVPVVFAMGGCEWFTDFKRQPSLWTWEPVKDSLTPSRGNPQMSVPVTGMAVAGFQVSYAALPATIDSMASLANPHPVNEASLLNGRKYYSINCAVCHGDAGDGQGAVTKYQFPMISLKNESAMGRSDGYIYGMIRNGRGLMPSYNRIEHMDRWDVVNYVRGLQGRIGRTVPTGPVGTPGETGLKVPGPTMMGPTRPSPHRATVPGVASPAGTDTTTSAPAGAVRPPRGAR